MNEEGQLYLQMCRYESSVLLMMSKTGEILFWSSVSTHTCCLKRLFMTASALRQERAEGLHEIRIIFNCEQRNKIPIIKM